jgi:hypothetical protein
MVDGPGPARPKGHERRCHPALPSTVCARIAAPRRFAAPGLLLLLGRFQLDRYRVDAVAQPGRRRPVVEDVAEMASAVRAGDLRPLHEEGAVDVLRHRRVLGRGVEAGPPAVGVELGLGLEQLGAAARAQVNAWGRGLPVLTRERPLGDLLPQDVVLGRGQVAPPLRLCLLHHFHLLHVLTVPR